MSAKNVKYSNERDVLVNYSFGAFEDSTCKFNFGKIVRLVKFVRLDEVERFPLERDSRNGREV